MQIELMCRFITIRIVRSFLTSETHFFDTLLKRFSFVCVNYNPIMIVENLSLPNSERLFDRYLSSALDLQFRSFFYQNESVQLLNQSCNLIN